VLWSGESACELDESVCENSVMNFQIKKRINAELFIDRMSVPHRGETRIRVVTNEGDKPVSPAYLED